MLKPNKIIDSLKKRYFYKLFSGFFGFLFNFISQAIIPRGLGPEVYGNYSFLTNFFIQLTGFVDGGTSTCFYTKLSQRPKEQGLVSFYFLFGGIVFVLTILFVVIILATSIYPAIWPNQEVSFIYLALGLGFLIWFAQLINQMADAYGLTVSTEILKMLQKFMAVLILFGLFIIHRLDLKNFFFYNYIVWLIFVVLLVVPISKNGYLIRDRFKISAKKIKEYIKEFWKYSHPLFIYSLVVFVAGIFDRWLLQVYGGSIEQGFYSLSFQIGAICFLFTGAMTPLFMRELAIAHEKKDLPRMGSLFQRYVPILFTVAAFFSCFIAIQADKIIYIFGGSRFSGAIVAVVIMAFYPIHQTYGQLSSSVFYAMGQTKLYSNLGIIFILIGLPITYFLIAPLNKFGMNAGATGLAIKMVVINIISVNALIYFNSRQLNLNFWKYFRDQVFSIGCLLILAFGVSFGVDYLLRLHDKVLLSFFVSGTSYSFMVVGVAYFFPSIFGIRKEDINSFIQMVRKLELRTAI